MKNSINVEDFEGIIGDGCINKASAHIINHLPIGVFIQDNCKVIFSNPKFAQIIGANTPDEVVGMSIFDIIHKDCHEMLMRRLEDMFSGKPVEVTEMKYVTVHGETVDVEVTAIHYPKESNRATLGIIQDISHRKALENLTKKVLDKEKILNEVEKNDQLKTEFFSNITHELRTPLNIILGIIQLLINSHRNTGNCPNIEEFSRHAKTMRQNCFRLLKLTNNLIDMTKIDSGFMKLSLKYYNIVNLIEDITQSIVSFAELKGIHVIFDTDVEEKTVVCDVDKIERIILNLISNAIKFTEPGGLIKVNLHVKDDSVEISISDTGKGIPKNKLNTIFERFGQANSLVTRKSEGSGIGLYLVKSFVQLHGGSINVKSEEGKGTEFTIDLPVGNVDEADIENEVAISNELDVERLNVEFSDIYP